MPISLDGPDRSSTIGKAFAANFDDATGRSFNTDKAATVVEFSGTISAGLHRNTVTRLANNSEEIRKAASSKDEADLYELNYQLNIFQPAHRYLHAQPVMRDAIGMLRHQPHKPSGRLGRHGARLHGVHPHFLNYAIAESADEAH